jgi:hypothetical protein
VGVAEPEIKNAVIESTMLGYEDHGILTCFITVNYGGAGQGFGGYALDEWNKQLGCREGTAYGMDFIVKTLEAVECDSWEKLKGKHVRVKSEHSKIHAIGHILKDKWFSPDELRKKHYPSQED